MLTRITFSALFFALFLLPFSCKDLEALQAAVNEKDIISGLKEALTVGSNRASVQLSALDGYFGNQALKILLPREAKPVIDNILFIPGGQALIDEVVLKMNRGAEAAASKSVPIFVNAITAMTVSDARNILLGEDSAATSYLRKNTYSRLDTAFAPTINSAMADVGATTAWSTLFTNYNTFANTTTGILLNLKPVNADLGSYATGKALDGLFLKLAEEEKSIRDNPAQRTTDLMKRVFKLQDPI